MARKRRMPARGYRALSVHDQGQIKSVLSTLRAEHRHVEPDGAGPPVVCDDVEVEMDEVAIGRILRDLELELFPSTSESNPSIKG